MWKTAIKIKETSANVIYVMHNTCKTLPNYRGLCADVVWTDNEHNNL